MTVTDANRPGQIARVGIVGGGQLARMCQIAGAPAGIKVTILDDDPNCPACQAGAEHGCATSAGNEQILAWAQTCDVITFDHEQASEQLVDLLRQVAVLRPSAEALKLVRDKLYQRQEFAAKGLPVPAFADVKSIADIEVFAAEQGWPVVIKARSGGYDGRGVWVAEDLAQAKSAFDDAAAAGPLYVEQHVAFTAELAALVARSSGGQIAEYPIVQTVQSNGICREVLLPSGLPESLELHAQQIAAKVVDAFDLHGIVSVELFATADGEITINEIAMRPHNAGHITIEACRTSQFEQHLRAVLGLPLGSTELTCAAAVMVNVLGKGEQIAGLERGVAVLANPLTKLHLYGKEAKPGRKVGHITCVAETIDQARSNANAAAAEL